MIYLYLFGTCFHFIYVFMIIGNILMVSFFFGSYFQSVTIGYILNYKQESYDFLTRLLFVI